MYSHLTNLKNKIESLEEAGTYRNINDAVQFKVIDH